MIQHGLSQRRGRSGVESGNGFVSWLLPDLDQLFGFGGVCFEPGTLFFVELSQDFDFSNIRLAAQTSQKALFDHDSKITLCVAMKRFTKHPRRFDVLNTIQKNQCLQR